MRHILDWLARLDGATVAVTASTAACVALVGWAAAWQAGIR